MSSRLLSIATVVFPMTSGAALACTGAKAKSACGSRHPGVFVTELVTAR